MDKSAELISSFGGLRLGPAVPQRDGSRPVGLPHYHRGAWRGTASPE